MPHLPIYARAAELLLERRPTDRGHSEKGGRESNYPWIKENQSSMGYTRALMLSLCRLLSLNQKVLNIKQTFFLDFSLTWQQIKMLGSDLACFPQKYHHALV